MKDVFIINPKGQKKEQLELIHQIQDGAQSVHELLPYTFLDGESVKERT